MKFVALLLLVCAIHEARSQECMIVNEITKVLEEAIGRFCEEEHQETYKGCLRAFFMGDVSKCDPKKFKFPQAPTCEKCMSHVDMKSTVEKHNVACHDKMICNCMYSNDIDCEEVCEKLYKDAVVTLDKIEAKLAKGEHEAVSALKKFCEKDPDGCEDMSKIPQEIQDKFLEDVAPSFKDLIKLVRGTAKSKAVPVGVAMKQGVELLFGGGDFGVQAGKCGNEVIEVWFQWENNSRRENKKDVD